MRKRSFFITFLFAFMLVGCSSKSLIETTMKCNKDQAKAIEAILSDNNIEIKSITSISVESDSEENAFATVLSAVYVPYDIESTDGKTYRITVKAEDKTLFSIVDSETGDFVYGGIGSLFN